MYAAAENGNCYTWAGRKYPRVTSILSVFPSDHLMAWAGKMGALSAAAPLVHAGLFTPDMESTTMAELERYVDAEAMREISHAEAIDRACDWSDNMRAQFRYRDHKGRIGSVYHYCLYERALGLWDGRDVFEQVHAVSASRRIWVGHEDALLRYAEYGKEPSAVCLDLAHHALRYVERGLEFLERFRPEFEALGTESVVVHTGEEYAGTMDVAFRVQRSAFQEVDLAWPFVGQDSALLLGDWKTSNYLSGTVRFQLAAYARGSFIGMLDDHSEHSIPDVDGLAALHITPDEPVVPKIWAGRDKIDAFFEVFCAANSLYRGMQDLPRANAARRYSEPKPPKRGERVCPIQVGGGR